MFNTQLIRELHSKISTTSLSDELLNSAYNQNEWFDKDNIASSLSALCDSLLQPKQVESFTEQYDYRDCSEKSVIIIMAGNIPFVGAADLIYALLCNYKKVYIKLSSKDKVTMEWFVECVKSCSSYHEGQIEPYTSQKADKVIATGSDNSGRYFKNNFSDTSSLIRANRSSVAIIKEGDSDEAISRLWSDVFLRYGLGCRNITQLLIDKNCDINHIANLWRELKIENTHYHNAYRQHRAVLTMSNRPFTDLGYALLVENQSLHAPLSQVNYTFYATKDEAENYINTHSGQLQCTLSDSKDFGKAQFPKLEDFADGVDVIEFLLH
ncbi:MAG: hypothetical protein R3Y04_03770 [Rikenellaceae bacterium]